MPGLKNFVTSVIEYKIHSEEITGETCVAWVQFQDSPYMIFMGVMALQVFLQVSWIVIDHSSWGVQ